MCCVGGMLKRLGRVRGGFLEGLSDLDVSHIEEGITF